MKISYCTHCNSPNTIPIHYIGREVKCVSCGTTFQARGSTDHDEVASAVPTTAPKAAKEKPGCFGCSMFLAIPIGLWGLYAFFSSLSGYQIESVKTSRELKINSDYEMQSQGKPRAEFERVSRTVTEEADTEQRIFSAIFSLILIGGAVGLVVVATKIDRMKSANKTRLDNPLPAPSRSDPVDYNP